MVEAISAHLEIWKSAAQAMQHTRPEMETTEPFSQPSPPRYEDSYSDGEFLETISRELTSSMI